MTENEIIEGLKNYSLKTTVLLEAIKFIENHKAEDNKATKLKEIFERRIEKWCEDIQRLNDASLEAEKENRNKSITVYTYEQNKSKISCYQKLIDQLSNELHIYRDVLQIINNVLEESKWV